MPPFSQTQSHISSTLHPSLLPLLFSLPPCLPPSLHPSLPPSLHPSLPPSHLFRCCSLSLAPSGSLQKSLGQAQMRGHKWGRGIGRGRAGGRGGQHQQERSIQRCRRPILQRWHGEWVAMHVGELGQALPSLLLFIPSLLPLFLLSIFDSPFHLFIPSLLHLFFLQVPTCVSSILSSLDFSLPLFIPSLLPVYVYICPSKCSY